MGDLHRRRAAFLRPRQGRRAFRPERIPQQQVGSWRRKRRIRQKRVPKSFIRKRRREKRIRLPLRRKLPKKRPRRTKRLHLCVTARRRGTRRPKWNTKRQPRCTKT